MSSTATSRKAWIDTQTFWSGVLIAMAFLAGIGLGARIAVNAIRWNLEHSVQTTNAAKNNLPVAGELTGKISLINDQQVVMTTTDQSTRPFVTNTETEVFSYTGAPTPLLPGENRPKNSLTLADLQPNDMVVVRFSETQVDGSQLALSIQQIP